VSGREIHAAERAAGRVQVPSSKSLTNRHLALALLAERPTLLAAPLLADDTRRFLSALRQLGFAVSGSRHLLTLLPRGRPSRASIDCGASGTMLRFVTAALTTLPGEWIVDGTDRLRQRPMSALVAALRQLGAEIDHLGAEGCAPMRVRGGAFDAGQVSIRARESSQFVSALLMAATRAAGPVSIEVAGLVSRPYVDLTREALAVWGAKVTQPGRGLYRVHPQKLDAGRVKIEGDFSSACYFAAGAALLGGEVEIAGLAPRSSQGDRAFFSVLEKMGASCRWSRGGVTVAGDGILRGADVDMADVPDQVPTLAALAPFARGETRIRNVAHVRLKESDRISAIVAALESAGAEARATADELVVPGIWAAHPPPGNPATIDPVNDHRIAMSFALLGLRRPGVTIATPAVVEKSYPSFWRDFADCFEAPPR
jgi:3-phosphoshikimate 1-carboxyvinyltransferase